MFFTATPEAGFVQCPYLSPPTRGEQRNGEPRAAFVMEAGHWRGEVDPNRGKTFHGVALLHTKTSSYSLKSQSTVMAGGDSGLSGAPLGIAIAVISSFINGSTFVLQKKGILRSRNKGRREETRIERLMKVRETGQM